MRFSLRHLFALMIVVALGIQLYRAYREYRQLAVLESSLSYERKKHSDLEKKIAVHYEQHAFCKTVAEAYQDPSDFLTITQRFEALKPRAVAGRRENE